MHSIRGGCIPIGEARAACRLFGGWQGAACVCWPEVSTANPGLDRQIHRRVSNVLPAMFLSVSLLCGCTEILPIPIQ